VIVFPAAVVLMSVPPKIFNVFATGVAVPVSALNVVGIDGKEAMISNIPACEITTP